MHRQKVERLNSDSAKNLPFAEYDAKTMELIGGLAKRWIEIAGGTMEAISRDRMLGVIRNLNRHFSGLTVRNVNLRTLEHWATARREACSARTFNYELETLRRILDYGAEHGILMENPETVRSNGANLIKSRSPFQPKTKSARYWKRCAPMAGRIRRTWPNCLHTPVAARERSSAMLNTPSRRIFWRDVDFELKVFTSVTQSKNHEPRTVPLFPGDGEFLA